MIDTEMEVLSNTDAIHIGTTSNFSEMENRRDQKITDSVRQASEEQISRENFGFSKTVVSHNDTKESPRASGMLVQDAVSRNNIEDDMYETREPSFDTRLDRQKEAISRTSDAVQEEGQTGMVAGKLVTSATKNRELLGNPENGPSLNDSKKTPRTLDMNVDLRAVKEKNKLNKCVVFNREMVCLENDEYIEGRDYRIEKQIGKGSYGRVVLTKDTKLKTKTARKSIMSSKFREDELKAMESLQGIVISPLLYAFVPTKTERHIFMEFVDGITLEEFIKTIKQQKEFSKWSRQIALQIGSDLFESILKVHNKGWIHKDLSGRNIIVQHGKLKSRFIDYGMAQRCSNFTNCYTDWFKILSHFIHLYSCRMGDVYSPETTSWRSKLKDVPENVKGQLFPLIEQSSAAVKSSADMYKFTRQLEMEAAAVRPKSFEEMYEKMLLPMPRLNLLSIKTTSSTKQSIPAAPNPMQVKVFSPWQIPTVPQLPEELNNQNYNGPSRSSTEKPSMGSETKR